MKKVVGFESASRQVHQFSTPGIYVVNVTGINSKGSSTSENVAIHVESEWFFFNLVLLFKFVSCAYKEKYTVGPR